MSVLKEKWQFARDIFKSNFNSVDFNALLVSLEFVTVSNQGTKLILATPTAYHKGKILEFLPKLTSFIKEIYPTIENVEIEVDTSIINKITKSTGVYNSEETNKTNPLIKSEEELLSKNGYLKVEKKIIKDQFLNNLNHKFTFDNYLVCSYNELLHSVAIEVVNNPGVSHNPLFVYSPVGLGKTHISQAIGHAVLEENPSWRIKYIPAETFKQQYVQAINQNKRQAFIDSFLDIDLLVIDDIQSLCNAEGTQAVFFQIYNQMHQNNKQIIITSDKAPMSLNGFTDRLISRFNSGIVLDVESPSFEDRIALIKFKLNKFNLQIKNSLIVDIADSINYSVREIESVVNTIKAKTGLNPSKELTIIDLNYLTKPDQGLLDSLPTSQKKLSALELPSYPYRSSEIEQPIAKPQRIEQKENHQEIGISIHKSEIKDEKSLGLSIVNISENIIDKICNFCEITKKDLLSSSRQKHIARARQFCMWVLKKDTNLTLQQIGSQLGNRNHATVIHAIKKVEQDFARKNSEFRQWAQVV
jgi:chromosomal replication initiator protein